MFYMPTNFAFQVRKRLVHQEDAGGTNNSAPHGDALDKIEGVDFLKDGIFPVSEKIMGM